MPRGDRTGPDGRGPMTGRGLGYCAGFNSPGFTKPGFGRGRGMAWGRGFRFRAAQPIPAQQLTEKQEKQLLEQDKQAAKQDIDQLKQEMQEIEKRLKEIK